MKADKRIPVTERTWKYLNKMRDPGETYDKLLEDMIVVYLENIENGVHGAIPFDKEEEQQLDQMNKLLARVAYLEASADFVSLDQATQELDIHDS